MDKKQRQDQDWYHNIGKTETGDMTEETELGPQRNKKEFESQQR